MGFLLLKAAILSAMMVRFLIPALALAASLVQAEQDSFFDSHLHYNESHARSFSSEQILDILQQNHVTRALVTGRPAEYALLLYRLAPEQIVPFLGVYDDGRNKNNWFDDKNLPNFVAQQLENNAWQGIGELHIFAENRDSQVLQEIARLAFERKLPLLMHADPAVIDTLYEWQPELTVIWAHAGTYPYPDLLSDYLRRYPNLYIDLSVRDGRIAPHGKLADEWYELFLNYPDRFLIGVDTFSISRWKKYDHVSGTIRNWLGQLPKDISKKIAHDNAASLFNGGRPAP